MAIEVAGLVPTEELLAIPDFGEDSGDTADMSTPSTNPEDLSTK